MVNMNTEKITVTVPKQQDAILKRLVDDGRYRTRQEILLDALRRFLSDFDESNQK